MNGGFKAVGPSVMSCCSTEKCPYFFLDEMWFLLCVCVILDRYTIRDVLFWGRGDGLKALGPLSGTGVWHCDPLSAWSWSIDQATFLAPPWA